MTGIVRGTSDWLVCNEAMLLDVDIDRPVTGRGSDSFMDENKALVGRTATRPTQCGCEIVNCATKTARGYFWTTTAITGPESLFTNYEYSSVSGRECTLLTLNSSRLEQQVESQTCRDGCSIGLAAYAGEASNQPARSFQPDSDDRMMPQYVE